MYSHRVKRVGKDGKKLKAQCWQTIHEIVDCSNNAVLEYFFFCIDCKKVLHSPYKNGNTNKMNRHACHKQKQNPITAQDKDDLKMACAAFVCTDLEAYNVVDGEGFKRLCGTIFGLGQKHQNLPTNEFIDNLPCRNTVKSGVHKICEETRKLITEEIAKAKETESISVAIDNWSDDHHHNSYFGVIVLLSYRQENGKIAHKKYTLNVDSMDELVKTKAVIIKHLYSVLKSFGLSEDDTKRIITIISDRGANIKFGIRDEGIAQIFCYAHIINNIVGTMLKDGEVKKLIGAASELCSYMKNSGLCKHLNSTLKIFSRTRWNGVYIMFDSILKNYSKIVDVLTEKETALSQSNNLSRNQKNPYEYVSCIDVNLMNVISKFLKYFFDITVTIEGHKKPTLHMVWPAYIKIKSILQPDIANYDSDDGHVLEDMKTAGFSSRILHK